MPGPARWSSGGEGAAAEGEGLEVLRTKIRRGIVAVGLAALTGLALGQQGQRLSDVMSAPPTSVQTPTITNPQTSGQQRPANPQQQPGVTDQRPPFFPQLARPERNEFQ